MKIFFDIGRKGAFAIFQGKELKKYLFFELSNKKRMIAKDKMIAFEKFLRQNFPQPEKYQIVGTYEPFGKNFKTVMNLSFLIALIIRHFHFSKIYLLNEWEIWRELLQTPKIPQRKEKKQKTVEWAKFKFQLKVINEDEADALIGGYYLANLEL